MGKITHGLYGHPIYNIWSGMTNRANNSNHHAYKNYGGRGISICDRWNNIENFIADMYPSYKNGLSIDRIDNDKGYFKDNCRWVTCDIQARNTRVLRTDNTSGYRGVSMQRGKWLAQIYVNSKPIRIGTHINKIDAAKAYNKYVTDNNLEHTLNIIKETI